MPGVARVRGTRDILPADQSRWQQVIRAAETAAARAGFRRVDPPLIEPLELFERAVGHGTDVVDKEMYAFQDRGGRDIVLRPEATSGVVRAYFDGALAQEPQPVALYTIGPNFRYDRPQKGRYRQHHQVSCEVIGDPSPGYDAEVIVLLWDWLSGLGLTGLSLQLNSIGDSACRPAYREALVAYYRPLSDRLCEDCRRRLEVNPLRLLDCKREGCIALRAGAPMSTDFLCEPCREHFAGVRAALDRSGIAYELNTSLVRGLDYYVRTAFEVWHPSLGGAQNTLGGGGRYDGLAATLGFPDTPGVGFGAGLERVAAALDGSGAVLPPSAGAPVSVIAAGDGLAAEVLALARRLRQAGLVTLADLSGRSLKARLRQAQRQGAGQVVIVGMRESGAGRARLKQMGPGGTELDLPEAELAERLILGGAGRL
ncbi:MAG: histidine--tRNA ligase [Candidatus Dormibacteria bacterium]